LQRPLSLGAALKLPSALPAELLGQRPDVVASRWQVAAQARGIDVAHAGFYPNVDLVGSLGYMATGGGALEFDRQETQLQRRPGDLLADLRRRAPARGAG
jgi:outer membrane protein TolC